MPDETSPEIIINGKRYIRLYHFMPAKYLYDMLAKDEVKIAIPEECNDPLEFLPAGKESEGDYSRPSLAFISFSTKCSSSLMWAHYADAHRGVCIEFTFPLCGGLAHLSRWDKNDFENKELDTHYCLLEIRDKYKQQYEKIDVDPVQYIAYMIEVDYKGNRPKRDNMGTAMGSIDDIVDTLSIPAEYYTKSSEWAYESEWRLMMCPASALSSHDGCFFAKGLTQYISNIILGKRYPMYKNLAWSHIMQAFKSNEEIMTLVKENKWSYPLLMRAAYDDNKYEIVLV